MDVREMMDEIARRVEEGASARAVFGDPITVGDHVIIPVATVRWGGGGGGGRGRAGPEEGVGGGMGMGLAASPVGFIEVTLHGAIFNPIRDPAAIGRSVLAGALAAYLVLRGLRKLFR